MKKRIGVLLSGCGIFDGSEIHETVLTLLALDQEGAKAICIAPNINQSSVINHLTNEKMEEKRNVLVEAARIARGDIKDLKLITAENIDGIILPGGFGSITNLSNFSTKGSKSSANFQVKRILSEMIKYKKPIGALCISPVTITSILSDKKPTVTIGNDKKIANDIEKMGGKHINCSVDTICVDKNNLIISTPAYMLGSSIKEIFLGINKLVEKIISLCKVNN